MNNSLTSNPQSLGILLTPEACAKIGKKLMNFVYALPKSSNYGHGKRADWQRMKVSDRIEVKFSRLVQSYGVKEHGRQG